MANDDTLNNHWVNEKLAALVPAELNPDATRGLARFHERRAAVQGARKRFTLTTLTAGVAVLLMLGLPGCRAAAARCWQSFCAVEASFLSKDHNKAPDFALRNAEGKLLKLADYRGKVVLLDFWATDCGGCCVEIPWFVELQQKYRDRGLVVLGLSLDEDGWNKVKPFIVEKKINYEVMIATDEVTNRYHVESMPTTLMIDKSGHIASTHVGLGKKEEFQAEIESLLKK